MNETMLIKLVNVNLEAPITLTIYIKNNRYQAHLELLSLHYLMLNKSIKLKFNVKTFLSFQGFL